MLLVDGIAEGISEESFIKKAIDHRPELVLLETSTPSFEADRKILHRLRKVVPVQTKIAFAGPHDPMSAPGFLEEHPELDFALVGEYELTLAHLAQTLSENGDVSPVPGLVYREGDGSVKFTGPARIVEEIDDLPWPARHFLPMERYFDNPGNIPEPALQVWGSRGCPFSCSYCIWPQIMGGNRYRPRNVDRILDEIEHVTVQFGSRSVYFDDDTFNIGKERMLRFCREKVRRKIDIPWAIMARVDLMDEETLKTMAEANLWAVKYGIESSDPVLLANVNKKLDIQKAIRNVELTKKLGIKVHLTFMFGIPGETRETIRKSVHLARKLDPDSVQFSILTPMPGTRIYDELMERGHISENDWQKYDGYNTAVVRTEALTTGDIEEELARAWRAWFRHRAIKGFSLKDIPRIIRQIPNYVRHPRAALNQFRSLFHV